MIEVRQKRLSRSNTDNDQDYNYTGKAPYDANADEILSQSAIIILKKTKMMKAAAR